MTISKRFFCSYCSACSESETSVNRGGVLNPNPAVIEALVKANTDVNARNKAGVTALMAAAMFNSHPAVTEALIKANADVNARDKAGVTPLMFAADLIFLCLQCYFALKFDNPNYWLGEFGQIG